GSGNIGTAVGKKVVEAGHELIISNSRGPKTLAEKITEIGLKATAGTVLEASKQEVVVIAVPFAKISEAVKGLPNWKNRIVIDATNSPEPDLETLTSSETVSKALPGARIIKAFSSLYAPFIDGEVNGGKRVLFYAGDDLEAKSIVKGLFEQMGFYPVDLGSLAIGGKMMQYVGGPLSGEHFTQIEE
ncbi:NADPH-dependent F420 reductase, partial [Clostridium akagii]|uniref:NADPH-dependent F420 reductase n=2 Tax=Clostridium akagii TaxID=91623 RepID=UPI00055EC490